MGSSVNFPAVPEGSSTAVSVADRITALPLPTLTPLADLVAGLAGLPDFPAPNAATEDRHGSRLGGVRGLFDDCADALSALHVHQNRCAALLVVLVERLQATARVEGTVLGLDAWQRKTNMLGVRAEIAGLLTITEASAGRFMDHAVTLVHCLPATMAVFTAGGMGWEQAVVIAEETTVLRDAGYPQSVVDGFEQLLLGKVPGCTDPSFRDKARRARERAFPDSIAARTRRAFKDRHLRIAKGQDGMSWLTLFGPSPTVAAIFTQCTTTAQAAQGPHEPRTLAQLRADVAAALLLGQSMDENNIHTPPAPVAETKAETDEAAVPAEAAAAANCTNTGAAAATQADRASANAAGAEQPGGPQSAPTSRTAPQNGTSTDCAGDGVRHAPGASFHPPQPEPDRNACGTDPLPEFETGHGESAAVDGIITGGVVPVFDDPDYTDPGFTDPAPEPWDRDFWSGFDGSKPPDLTPAPPPPGAGDAASTGAGTGGAGPGMASSSGFEAAHNGGGGVWPPLPRVTPVVVVPALSLLGLTDEPAWMEGVGPISVEVAKRLTAGAPSLYRVLVDPFTNKPLDQAPDTYRVTKAMRIMLGIRDEYCQFPGCTVAAVNCETDHVQKFESGGRSVFNNLQTLCKRHHLLKHFKDDKTRTGCIRTDQSFERQTTSLRGWTPVMTEEGRVGWTSPAGKYYPPEADDTYPPAYPEWVKNSIQHHLADLNEDCWEIWDATHPNGEIPPEHEQDISPADDDYLPPVWTPDTVPQPPPGTFPEDDEDNGQDEQASTSRNKPRNAA